MTAFEVDRVIDMAMEIISDKIVSEAEEEAEKPKKIGFCVYEQNEPVNGNDVAAKK